MVVILAVLALLALPAPAPAAAPTAHPGNYTVANRTAITEVVIHVAQGSYAGTIGWYADDAANVSAHYVVRSSDGEVTQAVRDQDVAWHAGDWATNVRSIGIAHEGFVDGASWFTDAMYRASAALTRRLCDLYGIPKDRAHITGAMGPLWNWSHYLQLVNGPTAWSSIVDNTTPGRFTASANWGTSTFSAQRFGADYRFAEPVAASDPAWYRFDVPATATYRVEVWYPASPGYNTATPVIVVTPGGNQVVAVDQRTGGGAWRFIGTFPLAAGDTNAVAVSRWTTGTGLVVADAVRLTMVG